MSEKHPRWMAGFAAWCRAQGMKEPTIRADHKPLAIFLEFLEEKGVADPRAADPGVVTEFQAHLMTMSCNRGRPYSTLSRLRVLSIIRRLYRYFHEESQILVDPTRRMSLPRSGHRLPRETLSAQEMRHLLLAPDVTEDWGLRDRALLEVLYGSGVRFSELVDLKVGDVDLEEKVLWVRQGKGSRDRVVPLGRWAVEWLGRYLAASAERRKRQRTERVFLTPRGKRMANWVLNELLRRHAKKAGIQRHVTAHLIRHTFATLLLREGADIRTIQQLLGHERLSSTQIYTHLDIEDLRQVQETCHPREKKRT